MSDINEWMKITNLKSILILFDALRCDAEVSFYSSVSDHKLDTCVHLALPRVLTPRDIEDWIVWKSCTDIDHTARNHQWLWTSLTQQVLERRQLYQKHGPSVCFLFLIALFQGQLILRKPLHQTLSMLRLMVFENCSVSQHDTAHMASVALSQRHVFRFHVAFSIETFVRSIVTDKTLPAAIIHSWHHGLNRV